MAITFLDLEGTPGANVAPNWTDIGFTNGIVDGTPTPETMKFTNGAGKVFSGSTAIEIQNQGANGHAYGWKDLPTPSPNLALDMLIRLPSTPVVSSLDVRFIDIRNVSSGVVAILIINTANKFRLSLAGGTPLFTLTAFAHPTLTYLRVKLWMQVGTTTSNGQIKMEIYNAVTGVKIHGSTVYSSTTANLGTTNIASFRIGDIGGNWGGLYQIDSVAYDPSALNFMPDQPPPNAAPVAAFTSSVSNLTATFNGSGSSDPGGTIVSYAWTFGDSTTGTGVSPSHTYSTAGTYTVGLIVTDNDGTPSTNTTQSVTVTDPPTGTEVLVVYSNTVESPQTSVSTLDIPVSVATTGAQANDLIIGYVSNERGSALPTMSAGGGVVNIPFSFGGTNVGMTSFWKRLNASDISNGVIRATFSPVRRCIAGFEILRGALDPVYGTFPTVIGDSGGAAPGVLTAPGITPPVINCYIRSQFAVVPLAAPFSRTFTPPATWTEVADNFVGDGTTIQPQVVGIAKQLGATTAAITGPAITPNDVTTHMAYLATTLAIAPAPTPPAVSDAGDDIALVEPNSTVQLNGSGSTGKAPLTYAWRRISGPIPFSWSSQTAMSPTIKVRGDMTQQVLTLGLIVTDADSVAAAEDTMTITILPASEGYWKSNGVLTPYVDSPL